MLNQVETLFDGMSYMMKKLKKASYERNMAVFREKNGHFFQEMVQYVEDKEDKEAAAEEIAAVFTDAVQNCFAVKGRIKPYMQADLNFFMIYYVFPAILLTESEHKNLIADTLCALWGEKFADSKISYAGYDQIYAGFRERILGIPIGKRG